MVDCDVTVDPSHVPKQFAFLRCCNIGGQLVCFEQFFVVRLFFSRTSVVVKVLSHQIRRRAVPCRAVRDPA